MRSRLLWFHFWFYTLIFDFFSFKKWVPVEPSDQFELLIQHKIIVKKYRKTEKW